jgi:hypothetical protein
MALRGEHARTKNRLSQFFQMEEKSGLWTFKLIADILEWILPFEQALVDSIQDHQYSLD